MMPRSAKTPKATPEISNEIYAKLRKLARAYLARERKNHTLAPTGLVHEAFLRLMSENSARAAFAQGEIPALARLMREVLTNHALARKRLKRGGERLRISLNENLHLVSENPQAVDLLELDETLKELAEKNARCAEIVECRYFLGLTIPETAEALHLSAATVKREWQSAKTWIYNALQKKK